MVVGWNEEKKDNFTIALFLDKLVSKGLTA